MPETTVRVTTDDILGGIAGDCFRCAVAVATARATGDEASVYEDEDGRLRVGAYGRSIPATGAVREFVRALDGQPRDDAGRLDTRHPDCQVPGPFVFELPDPSDPDWQVRCGWCGCHFDDAYDLDDRGECEDCRDR